MLLLAQYVAAFLLLVGVLFSLIAAIGMLRFPDLYTRMHAASKAGAVGAGMILLAVAINFLDGPVALRAVLGILFLLLTTPVATHLLARAAYRAGVRPSTNIGLDEMKDDSDVASH